MTLVSLLGLPLKSDEVIDLLEEYDAQVIYDFDRLHEGTPDRYHAVINDGGFELGFDEAQVLTTIWCHVVADAPMEAIDPELIGAPFYASAAELQREAERAGMVCQLPNLSHMDGKWAKIVGNQYSVHYEFVTGNLDMVTLQLNNPDEG